VRIGWRWAVKRLLVAVPLVGCAEPAPPPTPVSSAVAPAASSAAPSPPSEPEPVLLGRYTTTFQYQGPHERRGSNIRRIVSLIEHFDELRRIDPGDEWSFNVAIGPRSEDNGFLPAPAIFMGEVADDVGGGTCQASSTIHAAALEAGLDITMRTSHSRPSKYIEKGLDATVSYPADCDGGDCAKLDLRFKNPYAFPITMKVDISQGGGDLNALEVAFYGAEPGARVEHKWLGGHVDASCDKRFHKTGRIRTATYKKRIQECAAGVAGVLQVTRVFPDGRIDMQRFTSNYKPVDETWEVGLQWDMTKKPWEPEP
jgi:hypothetical protein